jgi:ribonuclease BN (tRNA processing enzyme)
MKLTIVGSGDAFGSGGRANTCFLLETEGVVVAVDFGATSLVQMRHQGLDPKAIDLIVLSHLHGDHFGGIPFLLLFRQFDCKKRRPLTIAGPVGTRERLLAASEVFFPGSSKIDWRFPLTVVEVPCGESWRYRGLEIVSHEVVHPSGAPSTGLRLCSGGKLFAYSGDTEWTDTLLHIAAGADLFMCECYKPAGAPVYHLSLATIEDRRTELGAKRIMLTHLSEDMLGVAEEARARGFEIAEDGLVAEI